MRRKFLWAALALVAVLFTTTAASALNAKPLGNQISIVDSSGKVRSDDSSLAIGADGLPVISYYGGGHLRVLHCASPACSRGNTISTIDKQPGVGYSSSIAIGADGLPLISYGSDLTPAGGEATRMKQHLKVAHCGNVACSHGNTIATVDKRPAVGYYPAVAIGADKRPVISYHDHWDYRLRVLHCGNLACTSGNTSIAVARSGVRSSIAIGADGLPLIVSGDDAGNLRVLHCGNRACSGGNRTVVVGQSTWEVSLTIGRDGLPLIGYLGSGLSLLHCGNSTCSRGNTTAKGDRRANSAAIIIGPGGWPLLSTFWSFGRILRVLHCGNRACTAGIRGYIVARHRDVRDPSLTIGADDLPLISYVDHTRRNLQVLHCGNALCRPSH